MTVTDIQRVEQALLIKLPRDYQQLLLDYPFSDDSFATACMVINDADALIKINSGRDVHFQTHHRKGRWTPQKNHFMIGNDGGEEQYYLDLDDPASLVLRFDLETGELSRYAQGIQDFKAKIDQVDRDIEEEEKRTAERRRSAKWWQLWRRL
jgi:hypothetical protein